MSGKVSVVIEQDAQGCYAWCPELKGCQSQGKTVEEALANIREAIDLFLETLTAEERLGRAKPGDFDHRSRSSCLNCRERNQVRATIYLTHKM
jgi:predicted RNase H-like HicB family nuclease